MSQKAPGGTNKSTAFFLIAAFIIATVVAALTLWKRQDKPLVPPVSPENPPVRVPIQDKPVITYDPSRKDEAAAEMMEKRKAELGVNQGVDLIVKADESVKIGDDTISMQEILNRIRLQKGDILEKDVGGAASSPPALSDNRSEISSQKSAYGIYIVQPGDNIWNVHFRFLTDYFLQRGIRISSTSDQPDRRGKSSGVGKIFKFSESMVHIYNLRERKVDTDLSLIHPLSKIVIFDLAQVFSLLGQIDYGRIDRIQFDGKTIWMPAKE